jgi:flagellin
MRVGRTLSGIELSARHHLLDAYNRLKLSTVRLSTMQRINSGSDDPAGLAAAENLRAELTAINEAADHAARAGAVARTADSALGQVSGLLHRIRGNAVAAASGGRDAAELDALQRETDAALEAIDRIGNLTSFAGEKLLDGGDMTFLLSPNVSDTSALSLPRISTSLLGGTVGRLSDLASGGGASLARGDRTAAVEILNAADSQVLRARAVLGDFEKSTIESAVQVLDGMEKNLSAALSQIFDSDVAEESSRLVVSRLLVDSASSSLLLAARSRDQIRGLLGALSG